ncbi:AAA family ATPase [Kitasatospora sp. LaBMicrA B282]|uniref:ATP-binding protein n=1 Tax=Kitasatospora sp. LaBMicrA B282 TaxID=3420949 RepID=UPI003D0A1B67
MDSRVVPSSQGNPVLGRAAELAVLDRAAEAARDGLHLLVLRGAPGMGRTALLDAFATSPSCRAATVLRATGARQAAFGVVRELFGVVEGVEGSVAAGGVAAQRRHAVHQELYRRLRQSAQRGPVVVTVDDAELADPESLHWLAFLLRRAAELPLLVVLSLGCGESAGPETAGAVSTEVASAAGAVLADLFAEQEWRSLELGPLGPDAVRELLAERLGRGVADGAVDACLELTGGRPRLLVDTVERLAAGTESVARAADDSAADFARAALAVVPAAVRDTARAVAVLGGVQREIVGGLAELSLCQVEAALDALAGLGLLSGTGEGDGFALPGFRAAALRALGGRGGAGVGWQARATRLLADAGATAEEIAQLAEFEELQGCEEFEECEECEECEESEGPAADGESPARSGGVSRAGWVHPLPFGSGHPPCVVSGVPRGGGRWRSGVGRSTLHRPAEGRPPRLARAAASRRAGRRVGHRAGHRAGSATTPGSRAGPGASPFVEAPRSGRHGPVPWVRAAVPGRSRSRDQGEDRRKHDARRGRHPAARPQAGRRRDDPYPARRTLEHRPPAGRPDGPGPLGAVRHG